MMDWYNPKHVATTEKKKNLSFVWLRICLLSLLYDGYVQI